MPLWFCAFKSRPTSESMSHTTRGNKLTRTVLCIFFICSEHVDFTRFIHAFLYFLAGIALGLVLTREPAVDRGTRKVCLWAGLALLVLTGPLVILLFFLLR